MQKEIAGITVDVNDEGYLTDASQWTKDVGAEIAKEEEIEMTDQHWAVIDFIQENFKQGNSLSIRSVKKNGPVSIKEFYGLFPKGPLKQSTRIAGIPKPTACI